MESKLRHDNATADSARKSYETPVLRVYGNVAALTKNVGMMGTVGDGAAHGKTKTS